MLNFTENEALLALSKEKLEKVFKRMEKLEQNYNIKMN